MLLTGVEPGLGCFNIVTVLTKIGIWIMMT